MTPRLSPRRSPCRQARATGQTLFCWGESRWYKGFLLHSIEYLSERDCGETRGVIGQTIGNDQFALVEQSAARIDNIGHVACPLVLVRLKQRFAETANHFGWIIAIQEERADAVFSHWADTMAEDQPPGVGLDRRSAVPELDQFPGKDRFEEHRVLIPEVHVVRKHEVNVLVVLAGEHGVEAIDFPRE